MAYVVDQIGGWQAPVDDDEMRAWATQVHAPYLNGPTLPLPTLIAPPLPICPTLINEQVHDLLASSRDLALEVFISRNLVGFLKEALERVGRVYQVRGPLTLMCNRLSPLTPTYYLLGSSSNNP